jgi:sporulation protein YlmC with PRC-barrel domain
MKSLAHATAVLALFAAAGFANAQDATTQTNPPAAATTADCPAPGTVPEAQLPDNCKTAAQGAAPADPAAKPAEQNADAPADPAAKPAEENADAPADPAVKPSDNNTTTLTPDQAPAAVPATAFLASSIIGQTVFTPANENVGEINDLVMNKDDGVVTAIVGVGGFLGMGEKNVAMPMDKLTATKFEDNTLKLVINATREELEAAPAFDPAQLSMNLGG